MTNLKLSISEIKNIKGFEKITNVQAEMMADYFALYSIIIYDKMIEKYENRNIGQECN